MISEAVTDMDVRRVSGRAFEDILDGYFPLEDSVRQMMERQGFASVWITLLHAPIMNIKGLAPTDPVPFSLRKTYAGMIEHMSLAGSRTDDGVRLGGVGEWFWLEPDDETATFAPSVRLGEPAFVRGTGIDTVQEIDPSDESGTVAVARLRDASLTDALSNSVARLGWRSCRAWGGCSPNQGISQVPGLNQPGALFGAEIRAAGGASDTPALPLSAPMDGWDYLLVDTSPDQVDGDALELARRL